MPILNENIIPLIKSIFSHPQILGLILDIIGAYYIVKSFLFKNLKELLAESYGEDYPQKSLMGGMSGNIFRSFYKQSVEAKTGFVIITVGFLSQAVGILFSRLTVNYFFGFLIILLAVLVPRYIFRILFQPNRLDNLENK